MVQGSRRINKGVARFMRTAIVYYSMSGNTRFVAERIAEKVNADIIRIQPIKSYPNQGVKKFIWGGKSAVMGEKPQLEPYEFKLGQYDRIIFGTPVWASNFAPPIRTFIHDNRSVLEKKIAVFMCFSGGGADKAMDKMKKYIGVDKFEAELVLVDPKKNVKPENDAKIEEFCSVLL